VGEGVEHTSPTTSATGSLGPVGLVATVLTAVAGGAVFALLTGKGTGLDSGLLLTLVVVVTTLHAARSAVQQTSLPATLRYGAVPLIFLPAIAIYAGAYTAVTAVLPAAATVPAELTAVHVLVAAAFVVAYVAIERDVYKHSERLYVALVNATTAPQETVLTATEEYNEY
jgi:NAD(P)H-quinone oxidoreductase subunit 5